MHTRIRLSRFIPVFSFMLLLLACAKNDETGKAAPPVPTGPSDGTQLKSITEQINPDSDVMSKVLILYRNDTVIGAKLGQGIFVDTITYNYHVNFEWREIPDNFIAVWGRDTVWMVENTYNYYFDGMGRLKRFELYYYINSTQHINDFLYFDYAFNGSIKSISSYPAKMVLDARGNVVSYTRNDGTLKYVWEYDSHPNPVKGLIGLWGMAATNGASHYFHDHYINSKIGYFNTNNITKMQTYKDGVLQQTETYKITYNSKKYPVSIVSSRGSNVTLEYY